MEAWFWYRGSELGELGGKLEEEPPEVEERSKRRVVWEVARTWIPARLAESVDREARICWLNRLQGEFLGDASVAERDVIVLLFKLRITTDYVRDMTSARKITADR